MDANITFKADDTIFTQRVLKALADERAKQRKSIEASAHVESEAGESSHLTPER